MLRFTFVIFSLCLLGLYVQSCVNPQRGALSPEVRSELDRLADDPHKKNEQKYIEFSRIMARLLDEASAKPTEAGAIAHITEFATENDAALQRLAVELDKWQKHMSNEDRMFFVMNLMAEKSTEKLQKRGKAFRRRISGNPAWLQEYDRVMSYLNFLK